MMLTCEYCGRRFSSRKSSQRFCGLSCSSSAVSRRKGCKSYTRVCVVCGKPVPYLGRKTCSKECETLKRSENASSKKGLPRKKPRVKTPETAIDRKGALVTLTLMPPSPWPVPVDPQYDPLNWQEAANAA